MHGLKRGRAAAQLTELISQHWDSAGLCQQAWQRTKGESFLWGRSCHHEPMGEMGVWWRTEHLSCTVHGITWGICYYSFVFSSAHFGWLTAHNIAVGKKKVQASADLSVPLLLVWVPSVCLSLEIMQECLPEQMLHCHSVILEWVVKICKSREKKNLHFPHARLLQCMHRCWDSLSPNDQSLKASIIALLGCPVLRSGVDPCS